MKKSIPLMLIWAMAFVGTALAADKEDFDQLEKRAKRLIALGGKPGMLEVALQRISTETGVPVDTVRRQHERHPNIGIAGLMIANVLANETKKMPEVFLSQREKGKQWHVMAQENKVTVDKLNVRLERLERAVKGDQKN